MIEAANAKGAHCCTYQVLDATKLESCPELQVGHFSKAFSNAAMHWILRPQEGRLAFFRGVKAAVKPGGLFVFEMGGLGNVPEMQAALTMVVARRAGLERARQVNPWFFPDERWIQGTMENDVGGWKVERIEREWRPTVADKGGVEGWVRLMGQSFFGAVEEAERDACVKEAVDILKIVCANPSGGEMLSYVRLRCVARRV
jgi:SAM-dependent methyltransferase